MLLLLEIFAFCRSPRSLVCWFKGLRCIGVVDLRTLYKQFSEGIVEHKIQFLNIEISLNFSLTKIVAISQLPIVLMYSHCLNCC